MTAIAWAIVLAGLFTAPKRDATEKYYEFNNLFDCVLALFALIMLIIFSFK